MADHTITKTDTLPKGESCWDHDLRTLFSAPASDNSQEQFELVECDACHLVRTQPARTDAQLARYYPASYYGGGRAKFTGFF